MKIVVLASYAKSLIRFRGHLLAALVERGHEVIACAPGNDPETEASLESLGILYRSVKLERSGTNPLRDVASCLQLAAMMRDIRPDIVFAYTIKPVIYGSLAARLAGVPGIYSMITGLGYTFLGQTRKQKLINILTKNLYRLALSLNRAVFFQNPDDRALFMNLKLVQDNRTVLVNGSGVDLDFFAEQSPVVTPPVFLLIARLLKDKGIVEYADAARILKNRYPHARFLLLGPPDENPSAIDLKTVQQWHNSGIIEYLGESDDVRPYIAATGIYVLPSYREGTPRTVLEAMAMGRPVVTTDVPGCRETVIDGVNGFLIRERDVQSLADAMERFILQPELIAPMGKQSRLMATEKYDVHKVNGVLLTAMGLEHETGF